MIDKIFPVTLKMHVKKNTNALLMYVGELHAYINECKERYIQYHPEKEIPGVISREERDALAGSLSKEDAEEMVEAIKDAKSLPPTENTWACACSCHIGHSAEDYCNQCMYAHENKVGDKIKINLPPRAQQEVKPHKCPVCEGAGAFIIAPLCPRERLKREAENYRCHACKGTGVLWG